MVEQALNGLKIAVTRPCDQAVQLARRIEQAGGVPLLFPLLEISAVQDNQTLQEQISRISQFNLTIFISPNAVQYGMSAILAAGGVPPALLIATVGQGSTKALRELGVKHVITPTERTDSEGLLNMQELQHVAGWRVLIMRGNGGRELLGDTLKARGAEVEYAACYRRSKPQQDISALLDAAPDALTVTSSESLDALWQMLDNNQRDKIRSLPLFVSHKRIASLAHRQGWRNVLPTGAGDDGMLSALLAWGISEDRRQKTEYRV